MSDIAIRAEHLSKQYRIGGSQGRFRYRTIRESLADTAKAPFKRAANLLRGEAYGAADLEETIWALRDVSFEVKHGEAVGIIGRNGAGKTTLLKILSRITEPTEGGVDLYGRVGSLLEVGTGFHPELTGRENIYLNGAILGMRRTEIERKFDEIVAFSEIEKFLDTPVKHYSSGMYVRLAFSVAAHLETEILLVDEVLAVGDAVFQKKCLGKMGEVAEGGRTVLFVSHNMGAVTRLCHRGLLLGQGRVISSGNIDDVIADYLKQALDSSAELQFPPDLGKKIQIRTAQLRDHRGRPSTELDREHPFSVLTEYEVRQRVSGAHIGVMLDKADGTPVCHSADIDAAPDGIIDRKPGVYKTVVTFPGKLLNSGVYQIRLACAKYGGQVYDYRDAFVFQLHDHGSFASTGAGGRQRAGLLALPLEWTTEVITEDTRDD